MHSDCLVLRQDPLAFGVLDLHKYFQNFTEFIGIYIFFSRLETSLLPPILVVRVCLTVYGL
jgi:hypothetical protein